MNTRLIAIFVLLTLNGCINSGPKHNLDFSQIENLNQLSGTYINRGEPRGQLLSGILFGWASIDSNTGQGKIDHSDIELIQVSAAENNITVSAIRNGCVVYSRLFVLHRDFEITNGKIQVSKEIALLARGAGDVLFGPSYSKDEIGLDTGQDAKFRHTGGLAGLVFLIIPVAGYEQNDVRFERTLSDGVYNTCKSR